MSYECYADMNVLKFGVGEMEKDTQCFGIDSVVGIYHCKYFSSWNNWEYSHQPGQKTAGKFGMGLLLLVTEALPAETLYSRYQHVQIGIAG